MKPIMYVNCDMNKFYEDNSFIRRIKDRFKISLLGKTFIKELNLNVSKVKLPSNFHKNAYYSNLSIARKMIKDKNIHLASKTYRQYDYNLFNDFEKDFMALGVVKSSKYVLRLGHKSIKNSCIVIYDASDDINFNIICSMAKEAKYIVLLSWNISEINIIAEYIMNNYGVAPIVTNDIEYALTAADFIISSRVVDFSSKAAIWYLDNRYIPKNKDRIIINDITYKVPWDVDKCDMSSELLGAILCQMDERDAEKSLKYNGIVLDKIKYNDEILFLE